MPQREGGAKIQSYREERERRLLPVHRHLRSKLVGVNFGHEMANRIIVTMNPEPRSPIRVADYRVLLREMCRRFKHKSGLYCKVDNYGRVHTPVTNLPKELRPCLSMLTGSFRSRSARKIYWAMVAGVPKPKQGRISTFLAKEEREDEFVHAHRRAWRRRRKPCGDLLRGGGDVGAEARLGVAEAGDRPHASAARAYGAYRPSDRRRSEIFPDRELGVAGRHPEPAASSGAADRDSASARRRDRCDRAVAAAYAAVMEPAGPRCRAVRSDRGCAGRVGACRRARRCRYHCDENIVARRSHAARSLAVSLLPVPRPCRRRTPLAMSLRRPQSCRRLRRHRRRRGSRCRRSRRWMRFRHRRSAALPHRGSFSDRVTRCIEEGAARASARTSARPIRRGVCGQPVSVHERA